PRLTRRYSSRFPCRRSDMPSFEHHGATIHYEEHGQGFPILTFAPAGLRSTISVWGQPMAPINPIAEWSGHYPVIVLDQRNAGGKTRAPMTTQDKWGSCTPDPIPAPDPLPNAT